MGRARQTKKSKKAVVILVVALVAVGCVLGYFIWANMHKEPGRFELDEMARNGFFADKTPEEIEELLNQVVEDGMFNISINGDPVFEDGGSEGNLRIENVPGNPYYMKVSILRDDTGEVIYESKGIKQEQYIESARLLVDLPAGDYPSTAIFTAIDPETLKEVGTAAAQITIHVLN